MNLREKLGRVRSGKNAKKKAVFETFGVISNPFPPASQPMGHHHLETSADARIVNKLKDFEENGTTQAVVIEGTQGTGKTNLLEYYERELQDAFQDEGYYIVRYLPDPEPGFESVLRKIIQAFGPDHIIALIATYRKRSPERQKQALSAVKGHEMRLALTRLMTTSGESESDLEAIEFFLDWMLGLRVLKRHQELLGIKFRMDTVESQTQALRDLIAFSESLGKFNALFLLLDELEKQDYAMSKHVVLRYLSAIRALIDALPQNLFAILAMTPDARRRYFGMLPALAGRLQTVVPLHPLQFPQEALELYDFYLEAARTQAAKDPETADWTPGKEELLTRVQVRQVFQDLAIAAERIGEEGVKQRLFLDSLHNKTQSALIDVES